jgi:hypothetical protein
MTLGNTNFNLMNSVDTVGAGQASTNPFVPYYSTRDPTIYDVSYPITKRWINFNGPHEWILQNFNSLNGVTTANWVELTVAGSSIVQSISGNDTLPVIPTAGNINILGNVVANGSISAGITTSRASTSTENINVQVSAAIPSSSIASVGLSSFNNGQFTVDANGFVSLVGGGGPAITGLIPDAFTTPGTSPVVPSGGNITIHGAVSSAGTTPVQTNSLAANTLDIQVQTAQAIGTTNASNIGLAAFFNSQFTVDSNGFVQINGNGVALLSTGTFTPTLAFGGSTTGFVYSKQIGKYWKIGPVVFFTTENYLTTMGSGSGAVTLTNLPFTSANDAQAPLVNASVSLGTFPASTTYVFGYVVANSTVVNLTAAGAASTNGPVTNANFTNTSFCNFTGFYWVS